MKSREGSLGERLENVEGWSWRRWGKEGLGEKEGGRREVFKVR